MSEKEGFSCGNCLYGKSCDNFIVIGNDVWECNHPSVKVDPNDPMKLKKYHPKGFGRPRDCPLENDEPEK